MWGDSKESVLEWADARCDSKSRAVAAQVKAKLRNSSLVVNDEVRQDELVKDLKKASGEAQISPWRVQQAIPLIPPSFRSLL